MTPQEYLFCQQVKEEALSAGFIIKYENNRLFLIPDLRLITEYQLTEDARLGACSSVEEVLGFVQGWKKRRAYDNIKGE